MALTPPPFCWGPSLIMSPHFHRIKGTNTLESENIKMGASHTAEIEVHMKLSIMKECWDGVDRVVCVPLCNPPCKHGGTKTLEV